MTPQLQTDPLAGATVYTEAEWHELRKRGIGASEAGTILGMNDYQDLLTLWARKTGKIPGADETAAMRRGHAMEQFVASEFSRATGLQVIDPGPYAVWHSKEFSWLFATPDVLAVCDDDVSPVECKSLGYWTGRKWREGGPPWTMRTQVVVQMHCIQAGHGMICAVIEGEEEPQIARYDFDATFFGYAAEHLEHFWEHNVLRDIEPTVEQYSDSWWRTFKKLHPADNGGMVSLPLEFLAVVDRRQKAKLAAKTAEAVIRDCDTQIKTALGDATYGDIGHTRFSFKATQERSYIKVDAEYVAVLEAAKIPFELKVTEASRELREIAKK